MSGTIEYREKNLQMNVEKTRTVLAPSVIVTPPMIPHMITAVTDSIFAEEFEQDYSATDYPEYRELIVQKMA